MPRSSCLSLALLLVGGIAVPQAAHAQAFDFETAVPGVYASLSQTVGGQVLTVRTTTGTTLSLSAAAPLGMGVQSVTPSPTGGVLPALRFSFLQPVGAITFLVGDYGADVDNPTVQAFDAANMLLGTASATIPDGSTAPQSLTQSFGGAGASYFVVNGNGVGGNSAFWEVSSSSVANVVPEPSTYALLVSGLLLVGGVAARRRGRSV